MHAGQLRVAIAFAAVVLLLPQTSFSQARSGPGKTLMWIGVGGVGAGAGLALYGIRARTESVPVYQHTGSTVSSVNFTGGGQINATTCVQCAPSESVIIRTDTRKKPHWALIGSGLAAVGAGTIFAIVGRNRQYSAASEPGWRLAVSAGSARLAYEW